jgi:putative colanic acid biosynthesis UDP-glucose lipid carrier transferase
MRIKRLYEWWLVMGEVAVLNAAFLLALVLRFDEQDLTNNQYYNYYLQLFFFLNSGWLFLTLALRSYRLAPGITTGRTLGRLGLVFMGMGALLGLFILFLKGDYSRLFFLYFSAILLLGTLLVRGILVQFYNRAFRNPKHQERALLIGSGRAADLFIERLKAGKFAGVRLVGWYADAVQQHEVYAGPIKEASIKEMDTIFVALPPDDARLESLFAEAEQWMTRFRYLPDLGPRFLQRGVWESQTPIPVIATRREPLTFRHNQLLKRGTDLLVSALVVVLVFPWLMPVLAILVKLDSAGPVFFKQQRTGLNDEPFEMYKIRTLKHQSPEPERQVLPGDARLTRLGGWLRKWSLDELPQFIHVLSGRMSLVGPRPHMLEHTESYRQFIEGFMVRHYVKPGLTGWAQILGLRGPTTTADMRQRVEADVWYLENWSWWLDLRIMWGTFRLLR